MDAKNTLNLDDAKKLIRTPGILWPRLVEAAGVIANSQKSSFEDLLELLKIHGLPKEWAAIALLKRTKRPCDSKHPLSTDYNDWAVYLKIENLI